MTFTPNDRDVLAKLWKDRHSHDDDTIQEQITVIREDVERQGDQVAVGNTGAYIHLVFTGPQSIPVGGSAIEWAQTFLFTPLEFTVPLPATEVPIPQSGYYDIRVRMGWASGSPGGVVRVVRVRDGTATTVWPPQTGQGMWNASGARHFAGTAPGIPFVTGDLVRVLVDHGLGDPVDLAYGSLTVDLVDRRPGGPIAPPVENYFALVMGLAPIGYWFVNSDPPTTALDNSGNNRTLFKSTGSAFPTDGIMQDGSGSIAVHLESMRYVEPEERYDILDFADRAPFTITGWVQLDETAHNHAFVERRGAGNDIGWELSFATTTLNFARGDGSTVHIASASGLAAETIYFVAAVYDGDNMRLYVNGNLEDTTASTINIGQSEWPMCVGRLFAGGIQMHGIVDEVAIFDYVLSASQITDLYEMGTRDA